MSTSSSDQDHHFSTRKKLQGPRPAALKVSRFSSGFPQVKKPGNGGGTRRRSPVVIYLVSPKVIHVRPEEFMGLVQRLTGKQAPGPSSPSSSFVKMEKENKLSVIDGDKNDVHNQHVSSSSAPSGDLAAYSSFCIDMYSDWGEF